MMSSTTRSTGLLAEALERLLAVGRLHDRVAVALEREAEHLPDGLLVVDEQDGGGVAVIRGLLRSPAGLVPRPRSYYSPHDGGLPASSAPAAQAAPARLARAPGQRPPLPRLVPARAASRSLAPRVQRSTRPAPLREAAAAAGVRRRRRRSRSRTTSRRSTRTARRGARARIGAASWFGDQLPQQVYGLADAHRVVARADPRARPGAAAERVAVAPGAVAGRDRRHGAPRRHRRRARRERQRERDRGADRARARLRAAASRRSAASQSPHTIVFLSTDGGAFGGLGAPASSSTRRIATASSPCVNLDAIAGRGHAAASRSPATRPRSPSADARRDRDRAASPSRPAPLRVTSSVLGQLIDLGFPFTLYEQGPFVAAGIPAITLTTGGDRPPPAFGDQRRPRSTRRRLGAARRAPRSSSLGLARPGPRARAGHGELRLGRRPHRPRLGDRARPDRAAGAVLRRNRRPLRALPPPGRRAPAGAAVAAHPACCSGSSSASFSRVFACSAPGRAGAPRPPNPATATAGDWPAWALVGLLVGRRDRLGALAAPPRRAASGHRRGGDRRLHGRAASRCVVVAARDHGHEPVRADLRAAGAARLALAAPDPHRAAARAARPLRARPRGAGDPRRLARPGASGSASTRPGTCSSSSAIGYVKPTAVLIALAGDGGRGPARRRGGGPLRARTRPRASEGRAGRSRSCGGRAAASLAASGRAGAATAAGSGRRLPAASSPVAPRARARARRPWRPGRSCATPAPSAGRARPSVLDPRPRPQQRVARDEPAPAARAARAGTRGRGLREPLQGEQRRPDEQLEADERRDRVPRQPEDERAAAHAERDRLPGPHRDPPEHLLDPELGLRRRGRGRGRRPRRRRS